MNAEKLEETKTNLEKAFEEFSGAHQQLTKAVVEVEDGEIVGYEEQTSDFRSRRYL